MIRYELDHTVGGNVIIDFNKEVFNYGFSKPQGGNFIIPKSGWYNIVVFLVTSTNGGLKASLRKNGSRIFNWINHDTWNMGAADTIVYCNAGDTISAHTENGGTRFGLRLSNNIYIRYLF